VFGVEVAGHQDRQYPAEAGGLVLSDQWVGRREVSRKFFYRSAGQYDLNGSSLKMSQVRNGHRVVDYTTADQNVCTATRCWSVFAVADNWQAGSVDQGLGRSQLREILTPCWLRKCLSLSFVLRTLSAFQQARRWALHRSVLGGAAIFGNEENNGLQDSPRAGYSSAQGGDGREETTG